MKKSYAKPQHFIPKFYQKLWGNTERQEILYFYDKRSKKIRKVYPKSANQIEEFYNPVGEHQLTEEFPISPSNIYTIR